MDQKVWKKLYDKNGHLVYEGYTLLGKPFGRGTVYFPNGNKFQEGKFAEKGLVGYGREYWSNGKLKAEAKFIKNRRYGPNYPSVGTFYNQEGVKVFSGAFTISGGSIGGGWVHNPEGYKETLPEDQLPDIHYFMWDDRFELEHPYTGETIVCPVCGTEVKVRRKYSVACPHCDWTIADTKRRPSKKNLFSLEDYKKYWDHGVVTYDDFVVIVRKAYMAMTRLPDPLPHIQKVFSSKDVQEILAQEFEKLKKKYSDSPQDRFIAALNFAGRLEAWY